MSPHLVEALNLVLAPQTISKNVNLEIIAKLLNSVAEKYGCYVRCEKLENSLKFMGDESHWARIIKEIMEFFSPQMEMAAAAVRVKS